MMNAKDVVVLGVIRLYIDDGGVYEVENYESVELLHIFKFRISKVCRIVMRCQEG